MNVFYESLAVGRLDSQGADLTFLYDPDWRAHPAAFPISLSMPMDQPPVEASRILPWLANLLPETHLRELGQ